MVLLGCSNDGNTGDSNSDAVILENNNSESTTLPPSIHAFLPVTEIKKLFLRILRNLSGHIQALKAKSHLDRRKVFYLGKELINLSLEELWNDLQKVKCC